MNLKATKIELAKYFEAIKTSAEAGELPAIETVSQFSRLSQRMHQLADEEWSGEAEDFSHLAGQLLGACKKGDVEGAVMLVESLVEAQTFCHRTYKS